MPGTDACGQFLAMVWLGGDGDGEEVIDEPNSIDICYASNVYLNDNKIYFD